MRSFLALFAFALFLASQATTAWAAPLNILPLVVAPAAQEQFDEEYGAREIPYLQRSLQTRIARQLAKAGADLADASGPSLRITLLDAKPSRLTFDQLSNRNALDFALSRSLGGAGLRAELLDASGAVIDTLDYDWYEYDLRFSQALTAWHDTERAFDFFALKLRKWYAPKV